MDILNKAINIKNNVFSILQEINKITSDIELLKKQTLSEDPFSKEETVLNNYINKVRTYKKVAESNGGNTPTVTTSTFFKKSVHNTDSELNRQEYELQLLHAGFDICNYGTDLQKKSDAAKWRNLFIASEVQEKIILNKLNQLKAARNSKYKSSIETNNKALNELYDKKSKSTDTLASFINSPNLAFLKLEADHLSYTYNKAISPLPPINGQNVFYIGDISIPFAPNTEYFQNLSELSDDVINNLYSGISIPFGYYFNPGTFLAFEYNHATQNTILGGIQKIILNILRAHENYDELPEIHFIDPDAQSTTNLGELKVLTEGENPIIEKPPTSREAISARINQLRSYSQESYSKDRFIIIHNITSSNYDLNCLNVICSNAAECGMRIIITYDSSHRSNLPSFTASANKIQIENDNYNIITNSGSFSFTWYNASYKVPKSLLLLQEERMQQKKQGNHFFNRVRIKNTRSKKGHRELVNIPYGINENQELVCLDFEKSNFATFICGASRSGKSNLLQVLLTSIFTNYHPDDIEVWLIDFKMTEFSRYIKHPAPHIRYLILDDSPDIVCDIVDRLTEILKKRQNIFKGRWKKLDEVPIDHYMPTMFILIDEFSVMSEVIANADGDYRAKMQMLLAKGAALGMRFIFSSQGFTSGTACLNDFSKKQIQQRIAMKTEVDEIKQTLDLRNASDKDSQLMNELPVYYALQRIPQTASGDHLLNVQILNISDDNMEEQQLEKIDYMNSLYIPVINTYIKDDPSFYLDKQWLYIDGTSYLSFYKMIPEMDKFLSENIYELSSYDETALFLGEPRKLISLSPIYLSNNYCENMLLISPDNEEDPAASIFISMFYMLEKQGHEAEVWSAPKNKLFKKLTKIKDDLSYSEGLEEICQRIQNIRKAIEQRTIHKKFFVLLGFDVLMSEMQFLQSDKSDKSDSSDSYQSHEDFYEMIMNYCDPDIELDDTFINNNEISNISEQNALIYNACDDIKYILTNGPKLGYHFIMQFSNQYSFSQIKMNPDLFRHKIFFKISESDASEFYISRPNQLTIAKLPSHNFRYTNGLESLTFRPYLHKGLKWDGWIVLDDGNVDIERVEEYLL